MSLDVIYEIIYVLGIGVTLYLWKRTHDKDYLRLFFVGLLSALFQWMVLASPSGWKAYLTIASPIIEIVVIVLVAAILFKKR